MIQRQAGVLPMVEHQLLVSAKQKLTICPQKADGDGLRYLPRIPGWQEHPHPKKDAGCYQGDIRSLNKRPMGQLGATSGRDQGNEEEFQNIVDGLALQILKTKRPPPSLRRSRFRLRGLNGQLLHWSTHEANLLTLPSIISRLHAHTRRSTVSHDGGKKAICFAGARRVLPCAALRPVTL